MYALRNAGAKYFTVAVDRARAGRLGLNANDVQDALRIWVDGKRIGTVLEGSVRRSGQRVRVNAELIDVLSLLANNRRFPLFRPRALAIAISDLRHLNWRHSGRSSRRR